MRILNLQYNIISILLPVNFTIILDGGMHHGDATIVTIRLTIRLSQGTKIGRADLQERLRNFYGYMITRIFRTHCIGLIDSASATGVPSALFVFPPLS